MSELDKIDTGATSQTELLYETRSEEMQEVIGKMPSWIVRRGIVLFGLIVAGITIGASLVKIPETVNCPVTLVFSDTNAIVRATDGGIIQQIFVKEGDRIQKGNRLILFNSGADFNEVQQAVGIAKNIDASTDLMGFTKLTMPDLKSLGELQSRFGDLAFALSAYKNGSDKTQGQDLKINAGKFLELYKLWENKYLIKSKTDGQLAFFKRLDQGLRIVINEELMAVSPSAGKKKLRAWGILPGSIRNTIAIGKPYKIILNYGEGGTDRINMQGTIKSIAKMPINNKYFIDIEIPDSFLKRKIIGHSEVNGVLEIVVKQQSALTKLMANYLRGS